MSDPIREKVIAAFIGFLKAYELPPTAESRRIDQLEKADYTRAWQWFESENGQQYELLYKAEPYHRLVDLVDTLLHGQADRGNISSCLKQAVTAWVESGRSRQDIRQLRQAADSFIAKVKAEVHDFEAYVPIKGLEATHSHFLPLGRCQLHRNHSSSELIRVLQRDKERFINDGSSHSSAVANAPSFIKVRVSGHPRRAAQIAMKEAELALSVLRLFVGSFYWDIHKDRSAPRCMGVAGSLSDTRKRTDVMFMQAGVALDDQYPGRFTQYEHLEDYKLGHAAVERLKNHAILVRINELLLSLQHEKRSEVAARVLRAINWFSKASSCSTGADSLMRYAICLEALLSEGRTPKETYGKWVAALVSRDQTKVIYPWGGCVSMEFGRQLDCAHSPPDRVRVVRNRIVELFDRRNGVAHGRILDYEIDPLDVLDLETLTRNAILSFVAGGWSTLADFKAWFRQEAPKDSSITKHRRALRSIAGAGTRWVVSLRRKGR